MYFFCVLVRLPSPLLPHCTPSFEIEFLPNRYVLSNVLRARKTSQAKRPAASVPPKGSSSRQPVKASVQPKKGQGYASSSFLLCLVRFCLCPRGEQRLKTAVSTWRTTMRMMASLFLMMGTISSVRITGKLFEDSIDIMVIRSTIMMMTTTYWLTSLLAILRIGSWSVPSTKLRMRTGWVERLARRSIKRSGSRSRKKSDGKQWEEKSEFPWGLSNLFVVFVKQNNFYYEYLL